MMQHVILVTEIDRDQSSLEVNTVSENTEQFCVPRKNDTNQTPTNNAGYVKKFPIRKSFHKNMKNVQLIKAERKENVIVLHILGLGTK